MALGRTKRLCGPSSEDRRRFQRVKVNLLGRYMLADRREFPCQVVNMSPGGMALIAPVAGEPGERVIAYVDHLGRLEGNIARMFQNGFAMTIAATARKRDKLAAQLTWLANRHILGLPEDRRHGRIVPRNPIGRLIMPNGVNLTCRIIDVSQSGAGIASRPAAADRRAGHARQGAGPRGAPSRGRLRHRVHPPAAPGLPRRQHHRRVNAAATIVGCAHGGVRARFSAPFAHPIACEPSDAPCSDAPRADRQNRMRRGASAQSVQFESNGIVRILYNIRRK